MWQHYGIPCLAEFLFRKLQKNVPYWNKTLNLYHSLIKCSDSKYAYTISKNNREHLLLIRKFNHVLSRSHKWSEYGIVYMKLYSAIKVIFNFGIQFALHCFLYCVTDVTFLYPLWKHFHINLSNARVVSEDVLYFS